VHNKPITKEENTMSMSELVSAIYQGVMARPGLLFAILFITVVLIIGAYCELLEERRKTDERCRRIRERSKMR
jgi:hypothetical protein